MYFLQNKCYVKKIVRPYENKVKMALEKALILRKNAFVFIFLLVLYIKYLTILVSNDGK